VLIGALNVSTTSQQRLAAAAAMALPTVILGKPIFYQKKTQIRVVKSKPVMLACMCSLQIRLLLFQFVLA